MKTILGLQRLKQYCCKHQNNTGPDYTVGFGRINVTEAIDYINHDNEADGKTILEKIIVNQGDKDNYTMRVYDEKKEIKITLVWDDPSATPNSDPALVNNLDLVLIGPDGSRYYPWTLDADNPSQPAVRTQADNLNNIEQVYVNESNLAELTSSDVFISKADFVRVRNITLGYTQNFKTNIMSGSRVFFTNISQTNN